MAYTMWDISQFAGTVWQREFVQAFKDRQNLFSLFAVKGVAPGVKTTKIPIMGALTANTYVPGSGNPVTLQAGVMSSVDLAIDTPKETSLLVDDFEQLQNAVDDRAKFAKGMTEALLRAIDTDVLGVCAAYPSLPAGQIIANSTAVAATKADVAAEVEKQITDAARVLDGTIGTAVTGRRVIADSYLYRYLIGGSDKQSPERSDLPFGIATGIALPVQGMSLHNAESTSRAYDAYTNTTTIKMYAFVPDAIAVGVQRLPNMEVSREALYKSFLFSSDVFYGKKDVLVQGFVECRVKVAGNPLSL